MTADLPTNRLGALVRELRLAAGLTQPEFGVLIPSQRTGRARLDAHVCRVEGGERALTLAEAGHLARALTAEGEDPTLLAGQLALAAADDAPLPAEADDGSTAARMRVVRARRAREDAA